MIRIVAGTEVSMVQDIRSDATVITRAILAVVRQYIRIGLIDTN